MPITPEGAGIAALSAVSDVLHHLLSADTARHGGDGPEYGEATAHQHALLDWETRKRLEGAKARVDVLLGSLANPAQPDAIELAARKYAGLPATTGELAAELA